MKNEDIINKLKETFNPEKLAKKMEEAGLDWSDKDAAASILEENRKTVLANIVLEYMEIGTGNGRPMSQSLAETKALADPRYGEHLTTMVNSRKLANRARVRYDSVKAELELNRTLQSTLRAEMSLR